MTQRYVPRPDDGWDETREASDGFTHAQPSFYPGRHTSDYTYPIRHEGLSQSSFREMNEGLGAQEVLDLFQSAVDNGRRETQQSLAGTGDVSQAVDLKLTIDLGEKHIEKMPNEVVNIIKDEVSRYVALFRLSQPPVSMAW